MTMGVRRPMGALSLVGASEGAKKRAARREVIDRVVLNDPLRSYLYRQHRDGMRIGERLRPCPWRHDERGCMGEGESDCCHGSGVLPARRARPR